jgi:hypothetical protein
MPTCRFQARARVHGDRTRIVRKENTSPERQIATNLLRSGVGTRAWNGEQDRILTAPLARKKKGRGDMRMGRSD